MSSAGRLHVALAAMTLTAGQLLAGERRLLSDAVSVNGDDDHHDSDGAATNLTAGAEGRADDG